MVEEGGGGTPVVVKYRETLWAQDASVESQYPKMARIAVIV